MCVFFAVYACLTGKMCSEYCEGEDFFGLQYGSECWCGSASEDEDVFRHGSATCEYPCSGDDEETCGGCVVRHLDCIFWR